MPYDYDSEFQDKFMRIATAVIKGNIDIHRALQYQVDVAAGKHTACTGLFLRTNPGRLVLYPLVAATCTMIFFGGDIHDGGVALITGLASGLIEYACQNAGQTGSLTLDMFVGMSTGAITGAIYYNMGENLCISSILLGTLYWFFYGTAFVIGFLDTHLTDAYLMPI